MSYSNEAKIASGVPAEVIRDHGAISAETAEAMAKAARQRLGADFGVGVTGVAGPSEQEGKAVGTVFIAIAAEGVVKPVALRLPPRRTVVKYRSVTTALVELRGWCGSWGRDGDRFTVRLRRIMGDRAHYVEEAERAMLDIKKASTQTSIVLALAVALVLVACEVVSTEPPEH